MRWLRKLLLLVCLALTGLVVAEVFQRFTGKTPEEALVMLGAKQVVRQSLIVNGQQVVADVWQLPDIASADPVRKARGKALIIGRLVYVFTDDGLPTKGDCTYPDDLPHWAITCDYVVDTGAARFVSGHTLAQPSAALAELDQAAQAAGWTAFGSTVWRKGDALLMAQASETRKHTRVALILQKERK